MTRPGGQARPQLRLALLTDSLADHPGPEAAAEDAELRAQWAAAGPEQQRRVLAAVARETASRPAPEVPTPAGELARWLHTRGQVLADPTPPAVPNSRAALGAALILLDLIRGGRDRPAHHGTDTTPGGHMGRKDTIKAAKAETARGGAEAPASTQGHLADRHIRTHTPERLHPEVPVTGDDEDSEDNVSA